MKAPVWAQRMLSVLLVVSAWGLWGGASYAGGCPSGTTIMSAQSLYRAYERNEIAADAKWEGKCVEVFGTIEKIGKDILGNPYVSLTWKGAALFGVQCFFRNEDVSQLLSFGRGDGVVIAGWCAGKMGNVILKNCQIVTRLKTR